MKIEDLDSLCPECFHAAKQIQPKACPFNSSLTFQEEPDLDFSTNGNLTWLGSFLLRAAVKINHIDCAKRYIENGWVPRLIDGQLGPALVSNTDVLGCFIEKMNINYDFFSSDYEAWNQMTIDVYRYLTTKLRDMEPRLAFQSSIMGRNVALATYISEQAKKPLITYGTPFFFSHLMGQEFGAECFLLLINNEWCNKDDLIRIINHLSTERKDGVYEPFCEKFFAGNVATLIERGIISEYDVKFQKLN